MNGSEENNNLEGHDGDKSVGIGGKIHRFENAEKDELVRQQRELRKAVFERKLSKFTPPPPTSTRSPPGEVKQLAQKFQKMPDAETEREHRRRMEAFQRKRSGFLNPEQDACAGQEDKDTCDSKERDVVVAKFQHAKLMFEDRNSALALEEEAAERKRKEEEDIQRRKMEFNAKSSVFEKLSRNQ